MGDVFEKNVKLVGINDGNGADDTRWLPPLLGMFHPKVPTYAEYCLTATVQWWEYPLHVAILWRVHRWHNYYERARVSTLFWGEPDGGGVSETKSAKWKEEAIGNACGKWGDKDCYILKKKKKNPMQKGYTEQLRRGSVTSIRESLEGVSFIPRHSASSYGLEGTKRGILPDACARLSYLLGDAQWVARVARWALTINLRAGGTVHVPPYIRPRSGKSKYSSRLKIQRTSYIE